MSSPPSSAGSRTVSQILAQMQARGELEFSLPADVLAHVSSAPGAAPAMTSAAASPLAPPATPAREAGAPPHPSPRTVTAEEMSPTPAAHDDAADVHAYMSRLLGQNQAAAAAISRVEPTRPPSEPARRRPDPPRVWNTQPQAARSAAPEKTAHLDALREVANQSAREAIQASALRQNRAHFWVLGAMTALLFVFGLMLAVMIRRTLDLPTLAAATSFLLSGYFAWRSFQLRRRIVAGGGRAPS